MAKKALGLAIPKAKKFVVLDSQLGYISEHKTKPDMQKIPVDYQVKLIDMETPYGYHFDRILFLVNLFTSSGSVSGALSVPIFLELYRRWITSGTDEKGIYVEMENVRLYSDGSYSIKGDKKESGNNAAFTISVQGVSFRMQVFSLVYLLFHNHEKVNPGHTPGFADNIRGQWVWQEKKVTGNLLAMLNRLHAEKLLTVGYHTYDTFLSDLDISFSLEEVN